MSPESIRVPLDMSGEEIMARLGLHSGPPLVILMGGAAKLAPSVKHLQNEQIQKGLARAIVRVNANVIDNGTDDAVMAMLNVGLEKLDFKGNYIGIAPADRIQTPGDQKGKGSYRMGSQHTHNVLVESDTFGEELEAIYKLAGAMAWGVPSLAVLINGGDNQIAEISENITQRREVIVLSGSGRLADIITEGVQNPDTLEDEQLRYIVREGNLTLFDIEQPAENFYEMLWLKLRE